MTPEQLAREFGYRIVAHRNKLAGKADDAVQVLYGLHRCTTVIEEQRVEHRTAAKEAAATWDGKGHERFEFRTGRVGLRLRQTGDAAEQAEQAVAGAASAITTGHTAAQRLVDEYTAKAAQVLRAGMSATGVGSTAALVAAVATVSDQLVPHYTRESASNLRKAHGELEDAARKLRGLTKELTHDGFADPGQKHEPKEPRPGGKGGKKVRTILGAARRNIGYHETGNNINKFGPPGQPWCAYFATDMWRKAGVNIPNYGFTGDVYRWGQQHGKAYGANNLSQARPGDVLLFGTGPGSPATSKHIGIVETVDGNTVTLIEGNASDSVKRNTYSLSSATFYGGVHP